MKSTLLKITSGLVLSLLLAGIAMAAPQTTTQSFDVRSGGTFDLQSETGKVIVESHDKNTVEVTVETDSDDRSLVINFKQSGNDVFVVGERERRGTGSWWNPWNWSSGVLFTVKVPREFDLNLSTGGGSISLSDLNGQVVARTSGGSINLGKIMGDVDVKTSGGSIKVEEVAGNIEARTSGGSIRVSMSQQPTADSRLSTSGGSVTAYLASDIAVDLYAKTSGGRVSSDFAVKGDISKKKIEGKINGGGPDLVLRTSGGSVSIKEL